MQRFYISNPEAVKSVMSRNGYSFSQTDSSNPGIGSFFKRMHYRYPVAFMWGNSIFPLNESEPTFSEFHNEIRYSLSKSGLIAEQK